jgi:MerR family transcriptional regulator, copper efflux regulator
MATRFQRAEVAQRSGFTPATLRYYEDIGLVTRQPHRCRPPALRRHIPGAAAVHRPGQALGCSLDETAELTTVWDGGRCAPVQEGLRATVQAKIGDAHGQIAELTSLAGDLERAAATLSATPVDGPCDDTCGCTADATSTSGSSTAAVPLIAKADATTSVDDGTAGEATIACTLGAGEMSTRLDDWNALLDGVTARHRLDGGLRLEFGPGTDATEIARLAAAERDCCRFFDFALVIDRRGVALEVHAPPDGQPVLTGLFGTTG